MRLLYLYDRSAKTMIPRVSLAAVILAIAAALMAQEVPSASQAGAFLFKIPSGWTRDDKGDVTILHAPSAAGTQTYIAMAADDIETDLRTSFNILWEGYKKQNRIMSGGEITPGHLAGKDSFYTVATAVDQNRTQWTVTVVATQLGNRIQTIMFASTADEKLYPRYNKDFRSFISSLRFTDSAQPPASTSAPPTRAAAPAGSTLPRAKGKFSGLYRAVGQTGDSLSPQRGIGYKFVVFLPDGRFRDRIAEQGLDKLDEDAEIRFDPVGWGTYEVRGDAGRIVFPPNEYSSNAIVWSFKQYPDRLVIRGDEYHLLDPCNDLRLEGTFRRSDYQTTYGSRQGITFTRDGQFADEGVFKAAGVMVRNAAGRTDFDDGAPGRGTYRIANYTLELTYSNGRVKRTSLYIEPGTDKANVREFYLNTWKFSRTANR